MAIPFLHTWRIQWKFYNLANPEILKLSSLLNSKWAMKFYFLRMNSDEVGTTLKHPETINGNVKNLSKSECHFYFENLTLPLITMLTNSLRVIKISSRCLKLSKPTRYISNPIRNVSKSPIISRQRFQTQMGFPIF